MTIYIDVVLLENIAMNYIILSACGLIENRKVNILKILISSSIGGIYSILYYVLKESVLINILSKFLISILMVKIAFKSRKCKTFFKQLINFYIVSFMIGGVGFMLLFLISPKNIIFQNGHLVGTYPIKIALSGGIIGFSIITIISNIQKRKVENQICDIEIFYKDRNIKVSSFIDTGNLLKDPISNHAVIIVEKDSLKNLVDSSFIEELENVKKGKTISNGNDYIKNKIKLIPFSSLGNENGLLVGFKSDYIKIYNDEIKIVKNVIIGLYDGKLTSNHLYTCLIGLNILKESDISDRFIANA